MHNIIEKNRFHLELGNLRTQDHLFNAIDDNDLEKVKKLIEEEPSLISAIDDSSFYNESKEGNPTEKITKRTGCIRNLLATPVVVAKSLKRKEILKYLENRC